MRVIALLFVVVVATVLMAPESRYSATTGVAAAGMYEAPRPDGTSPPVSVSADDDMVCINGVCAPKSFFQLAGSSTAGDCSGVQRSSSGCSGYQSSQPAFPMARAFGAGMYRLTHPRTWFPRARARAGCGG